MKKFLEGLKDILYDGIDYILMIIVIAGVALIINWRLGGLFSKNTANTPPEIQETVTDNNHDDSNNEDEDKNKLDNEDSDIIIKINIPPGSASSKIGEILVDNNLIENENDFIEKAIELKLDTKLKYGDFEIPQNSSLEEILEILTK